MSSRCRSWLQPRNSWRTSRLFMWVRHKTSGTFSARPSPHLYPLASAPSSSGSQLRKSVLSFHCLTLLAPRCWSWEMSSPTS
jgi:hypothetical protein